MTCKEFPEPSRESGNMISVCLIVIEPAPDASILAGSTDHVLLEHLTRVESLVLFGQ